MRLYPKFRIAQGSLPHPLTREPPHRWGHGKARAFDSLRCTEEDCIAKNNMKKNVTKALAVVAAVAMVSMTSVSVFAVDGSSTNENTTANTQVKYTVNETYTWSVPTEIDFTQAQDSTVTTGDNGTTPNVKVTNNVIPNDKKLHIVLQSTTHSFKVVTTDGAELQYSVKVGSNNTALAAGDTVLDVNAGAKEGAAVLKFELKKDSVEKAGTYSDQITFAASVAPADGSQKSQE